MFQEMKGFFYKHYMVYRKSRADQASLLIHPLVGLFSIGMLALYLSAVGSSAEIMPFVIVGVVAWTFYDLCQRSMVYGMTYDIWDWCLKHMIASPATIADYIAGNSLFGLSAGIFAVLLLSLMSIVFFSFSLFSAGAVLVFSLLIMFVFAMAVGIAIDSLMVKYNKEYLAFVWSMPGIVMVFSGVYYPIDLLPAGVQAISHILPTTYAIDAMRIALGLSAGTLESTLIIGFALSVSYLAAFSHIFSRALLSARKTGRTIS